MPIRVLALEESRGASAVVAAMSSDREFEAVAATGFDKAVDAVRTHAPHVLLVLPDSELSALQVVAQVMAQEPVPILVFKHPAVDRERALKAGAVEVMASAGMDPVDQAELRARVRTLSFVKVIRHIKGRERATPSSTLPVVGIAASTGGPQAVATVLKGLGGIPAAVLVVQHMHEDFMANFSEWMDRETALKVRIAVDRERLEAGRVYIAPPNVHLKLGPMRTVLLDPEPVTLHRPSADVLFASIAEHGGHDAVGVLLTGMGDDGADGLLRMRLAGAHTIAQDEASSAVYGMPGVADRIGAATVVLPLDQIAAAILEAAVAVA